MSKPTKHTIQTAAKHARTKAKKPKVAPRGKALAPALAIEANYDCSRKPLLREHAIHQDLKPIFDALISVTSSCQAVTRCYIDLLALKESQGLPKQGEWPDSPELDRDRAQHAGWVKAVQEECAVTGESVFAAEFLEPCWTRLMRRWSACYLGWWHAIADARELMQSAAVGAIMDAGESRPLHRWTTRAIVDLDNLAGLLHPFCTGGVEGLGFIRWGLPPLPPDFRTYTEAMSKRIGELRSISVTALDTVPTVSVAPGLPGRPQRAAAAVDVLTKCPDPSADADESLSPALTENESSVMHAMHRYDASLLLSTHKIGETMKMAGRLSVRTIELIVKKLIGLGFAERPEGNRKGARLTMAGRRLVPKIAKDCRLIAD